MGDAMVLDFRTFVVMRPTPGPDQLRKIEACAVFSWLCSWP